MDEYYLLGAGIGAIITTSGILAYIRKLKRRLRRYVLRYEKIEKHFGGKK